VARFWAWLWFVCLCAALVASNPRPAAYQAWLATQLRQNAGTGVSALNRLVGAVGAAVATNGQHTERRNLELASLYTTSYAGRRIAVLGIASRFAVVHSGPAPRS